MISRTLSTPVLLAASISMQSMSSPRETPLHDSHWSHGCVVGPVLFSQLRHLARMRAVEVFPVPRVPQNRYACAIRPDSIARLSVCAMCSCPTSSSKLAERYFRARTVYDIGGGL